jgi:hypothetical protein
MSIRHGLLALLESGSRYGYELRASFESSTGATWPLNIGQVYTTLSRLERDGLVLGERLDQAVATSPAGSPRPSAPPTARATNSPSSSRSPSPRRASTSPT